MKKHKLTYPKVWATILLMALAFHPIMAQPQKPDITVTIFRDLVRFAAPSEVQEMRIEVFGSTGEKIFDSNFVAGQTQDWLLENPQGKQVESGLYAYTVTIKDQAGILKQTQRGNVILDRGREGLEAAPPVNNTEASPPHGSQQQLAGSWNVDQGKTPYIINTPAMGIGTQNPQARVQIGAGAAEPITKGSTLILQEGEATGMVLNSTTGGEMFFFQDKRHGLFGTASDHPLGIRTNNHNRLWINSEGNVGIGTTNPTSPLTVAGVIEMTSGGIKFPDGTIQTTAASGFTTNGDNATGRTGADGKSRANKGVEPAGLATDPWLMGGNDNVTSDNFLGATNSHPLFLGTRESQPVFFRTSNLDRMQITSDGRVGIGAMPTQAKLSVTGAGSGLYIADISGSTPDRARLGIGNTNTASGSRSAALGFYARGANGQPLGFEIGTDRFGNGSNDLYIFDAAAGLDRFYIGSTGNVGIGAVPTDPAVRLQVSGGEMLLDNRRALWIKDAAGFRKRAVYAGEDNVLRIGSGGGVGFNRIDFDLNNPSGTAMTIANGNVGIGASNPTQRLDVNGNIKMSGVRTKLFYRGDINTHVGSLGLYSHDGGRTAVITPYDSNGANLTDSTIRLGGFGNFEANRVSLQVSGNLGVGTPSPEAKLQVLGEQFNPTTKLSVGSAAGEALDHGTSYVGLNATRTPAGWVFASDTAHNGGGIIYSSIFGELRFIPKPSSSGLSSGFAETLSDDNILSRVRMTVNDNGINVVGNVVAQVLHITGGADLSEHFEVNAAPDFDNNAVTKQIEPGLVVSIDPDNPGKLVVSGHAYDKSVAGIISGAGGVKPGMLMGQSGSIADGSHPVALTGRVYCWADASNGPINPGDLLTASNTPGHAMKVTNHAKAQGSIIGKAMTSLKKGKGLVLVLVTLQ